MRKLDNQVIEPSDVFYPNPEAETEPLEKPTEEAEGEQDPEQDESELENSEEQSESEELEAEEGETDNEEDALYVDLDGEEHSLDEVKKWKAGHLMQSDYTKKTQALAEDRKALNEDRESFNGEKSKLADLSAQLEVLVAEDEEIDWKELKEYEPDKYIELKEKADKRKAKLAEVKAESKPNAVSLTADELTAERTELFKSNPNWMKNDKPTDEYTTDMTMLQKYLSESGYSDEEFKTIQYAHHINTMLDAARFNAKKKQGSALKKKVKKAPLTTKPKANQKKATKSAEDVFYGSKK